MNKHFLKILYIILGAFVFSIPALYNGYPLVNWDTGTYIISGYSGEVPIDRPLTYGLFLRHSSMVYSFWFTILAQSLFLSLSLYILLRKLITCDLKFHFYFSCLAIILTSCTSVGWYAGQLMPDIFSAILILSISSLFLDKSPNLIKLTILSFLILFSASVHYSHLFLTVFASAITLLIKTIPYFRRKLVFLNWKKSVLILCLGFSSFLFISVTHYQYGAGFRLSRGSHVFLMAHMIDTGVMKEYLQKNCDKENLKMCDICKFKDSLQLGTEIFLWNWNSVLYKTGGWVKSEDEYQYAIKEMLSDPKYLFKSGFCSFRYGLTQLFLNSPGAGLVPAGKSSPPHEALQKYLPWEETSYLLSRQQNNELGRLIDFTGNIQFILLVISVLTLLNFYSFPPAKDTIYYYGLLIFCLVICNAFITAGINIPHPRLQSRVAWLIPMMAILVVIQHHGYYINRIKYLINSVK